jgi:hypothetical protein
VLDCWMLADSFTRFLLMEKKLSLSTLENQSRKNPSKEL